jgi:hypothetical protein
MVAQCYHDGKAENSSPAQHAHQRRYLGRNLACQEADPHALTKRLTLACVQVHSLHRHLHRLRSARQQPPMMLASTSPEPDVAKPRSPFALRYSVPSGSAMYVCAPLDDGGTLG